MSIISNAYIKTSGNHPLVNMSENKETIKCFKCIMSLEKANILKIYPELIKNSISKFLENDKNIFICDISFSRADHNLKMNNVLFVVKYSVAE